MAESEEEWIRKRAYALWEEEGYPADKDREHWERAKLEYATLKPTASTKPPAAAPRSKATAVKAPKAAAAPKAAKETAPKPPKAASKPAASKAQSPKDVSAKPASAKAASKTPAAISAAVEPAKKRSKKVPAGE